MWEETEHGTLRYGGVAVECLPESTRTLLIKQLYRETRQLYEHLSDLRKAVGKE